MITAQEAREKALEEEKRKAEEQITAAMERGEYECRLDFSPSEALKALLKSSGYNVRPIMNRRDNEGDSSSRTLVGW